MDSTTSSRVERLGSEHLPSSGGFLVLPNRLAREDLSSLESVAGDRKIVYLLENRHDYDPALDTYFEKDDVEALEFACEPGQALALKQELQGLVGSGTMIVFVPPMTLVRAGQNQYVPSPVLRFLLATGVPVIPLHVDHPAESRMSIEAPTDVSQLVLSFGELLEGDDITFANFQEGLMVAAEIAFSQRPILQEHLARALIKGLKKHGKAHRIIDGNDGSELTFDKLLAASIVLAKFIRKQTSQDRVGVILPPGKGGMIANLAVLFAGKIPVNLNFTAGEQAVESCIQQSGIDRFITASAFIEKMSRFPWPPEEKLILLEKEMPSLKKKIPLWLLLTKLFSAERLASMLEIPEKGDREEAILLFTSGSSGDPKGVVLSHRNVLGNVNQFGCRVDLGAEDKILGCLPLFHSFGCTVTLWYPIIEGITLVTYPSPLETATLAELIEKHQISLVLATPTFLRGYLRKAKPEQLACTKLVVTGAEKLPAKVAEAFEKRFDKPVLEGYGLTETSPVSNVNLPDPKPDGPEDARPVIPNRRLGSVGAPIPGVAIRITDPDTDAPLPLHESGMIWLRGCNIFEGYLNQPEKTAEVIQGSWFRTGDIGRVDEDGFLYIEGRLSRFSKIGGEMVPHETVEAAINEALGLDSEAERKFAIVGVPDDAKGEALILLSAEADLKLADLRSRLLEKGVAALWIPKTVVSVEAIPILASGKLDLKGCENAAKSNA